MATDNMVRVVFEAVTRAFNSNIDTAMNQAENRIEQFSRNSSSLLEAGFAGATAAITAKLIDLAGQAGGKLFDTLLGDPVKLASDFEAQMSKIRAISGATEDEMKTLAEAAKEIGENTALSASEGAEALQYMSMSGWNTEQMTAALKPVADLAIGAGESLGSVSDIVTDSMTAFGLAANEATRFADVLAVTSTSSSTNIAMMGETFKYVAPVAGALGYTIEDTAVQIGLLAGAGIKGSTAGTTLRTMMNNLVSPTSQAKRLMDELGISVINEAGEMKSLDQVVVNLRQSLSGLSADQQAQAASTLAGTEAMSGLITIVNASDEAYNELADAINNCDGTASDLAATMSDNLLGRVNTVQSKMETWGLSIGERIIPHITNGFDHLLDKMNEIGDSGQIDRLAEAMGRIAEVAIDSLITQLDSLPDIIDMIAEGAEWLAENFETVKIVLSGMADLFVFTKIYEGVSFLSNGLFDLIKNIKSADGSFKILNATMKANIIIFIISLVISLALRFNELCEQTGDIGTAFKVLLMEIGKSVLTFANIVLSAINLIFTALENLFGKIPIIGDLFGFAADMSKRALDGVSGKIQSISAEIDALLNKSAEISIAATYDGRQEAVDEKLSMMNSNKNKQTTATIPSSVNFSSSAPTSSGVSSGRSSGSSASSTGSSKTYAETQIDAISDKYKHSIEVLESRREVAKTTNDTAAMNINTIQLEQVLNNKLSELNNALVKATKQSDKDHIETERNKLIKEIADTSKQLRDNMRESISLVDDDFSISVDVIESRRALAEKTKDRNAYEVIGANLLETLKEKFSEYSKLISEADGIEQLNILETESNKLLLKILTLEEEIAKGFSSLIGEFNKPSKLGTLTQYQSETANGNSLSNRMAVNNNIAMYLTLENLGKGANEKVMRQAENFLKNTTNDFTEYFMKDVSRGSGTDLIPR